MFTTGPWFRLSGNIIANTVGPDWANPLHFVAEVTNPDNAKLVAAAPDLLAAARRALPWLGKLIAEGAHLNSVAPNDAVGAMQQLTAAIERAGAKA